jgi:hypothetical protein
MNRSPPSDATRRWHDLVDLLTAIRGRAQATRRRVQRVNRLNREHIAADLALIEARTDKIVALLLAEEGPQASGQRMETAMDSTDENIALQADRNAVNVAASDRRARDGAAGAGDMLGGLGAGAGDRLGPDDDDQDEVERRPSPNQHSFAGEEFATDTARHYHGPDEPA